MRGRAKQKRTRRTSLGRCLGLRLTVTLDLGSHPDSETKWEAMPLEDRPA